MDILNQFVYDLTGHYTEAMFVAFYGWVAISALLFYTVCYFPRR